MPYTYTFTTVTPTSEGDLVCGVVHTKTCNPADRCCNQGLYKISLHINDECRSAVSTTTFGDTLRYPTYDTQYGKNKLTFKVTRMLGINVTNADGMPVCFQLRAPCSTLPTFCYKGSCQSAVFNEANNCCPVTNQVMI